MVRQQSHVETIAAADCSDNNNNSSSNGPISTTATTGSNVASSSTTDNMNGGYTATAVSGIEAAHKHKASQRGKSSPAPPNAIRMMESGSSAVGHWGDAVSNRLKTLILAGSRSKAAMACLLYSACSILMVLSNKNLATGNIDLNLLIVLFQAFFAVVCVETCKRLKIVEHYNGADIKTAVQWAPVNIFFCCMLFSGMTALKHNSVPMVTIFKNVTNIVTATGDYFFFGNNTNDPLIIGSFAITLFGAIFAAKNDITATPLGLFWMVFNCLSTSGYVLYMKFATNSVKLSKFGMVYYNNLLCMIFLLPISSGQMVTFLNEAQEYHTWGYGLKNAFAGFLGFFLNFASLNCVSQTGPTTYAVIGSLNKVPLTFLGYYLFDSVITPQTWFFIIVSLCGGFLYSYAKIMKSNHKNNNTTTTKNDKNNSSAATPSKTNKHASVDIAMGNNNNTIDGTMIGNGVSKHGSKLNQTSTKSRNTSDNTNV